VGQLLERRCGRAKQQRIERFRLLASESTQFGGQREGDQEVRNRQEQHVLLGEPGLGGVLLAGRAVAVATGVVAVTHDLTGWAGVNMAAQCLGSAVFNRVHGHMLVG
jgi:hypothetical protein